MNLRNRGGANRVFDKPGFLSPCQKGPFWRKRRKWRIWSLPTENEGFAPQTAENDEKDENGGCHSGQGHGWKRPGLHFRDVMVEEIKYT